MGAEAITTPAGAHAGETQRRGWAIVLLLFLAMMLNYVDKTVVGIAGPALMAELHLTPERYGLAASAFFSLYAASGLAVAFLAAPRIAPRWIMAALLVVWGVAQLPIAFAASFGTLVACRIVLGMGEGPGTPTAINACHEWFPSAERNMPTALVLFGAQAGSLLAAPVLSYVIAMFGWRAAFLACSGAGLVLAAAWLGIARTGPHSARSDVRSELRTGRARQRELWLDPTIVGNLVAGFAGYWVVGFTVAWLPIFVRTRLGLGLISAGWLLSAIYAVQAALLLLVAYVSQRLLRAGQTSRVARGLVMAGCLTASGVAFLTAAVVPGAGAAVVLVTLATALPLAVFTLGAAMVSEVAPAEHRNRLVTVIFSVITLAAIPSPLLTGRQVSTGGDAGWSGALLVLACVAIAGGIVAALTLRPEEAIRRIARRLDPHPIIATADGTKP